MHDIIHLILYRSYYLGIAVAGVVNSDAAVEIKIRCLVLIIEIHSLCELSKEIKTLIGLYHILIDLVLNVLYCQTGVC